MSMDLLERYLQAVGQYLPSEMKGDTLAELQANLLEQMDARAEELGRPLTDLEAGSVLRAHGKPELVALRYLPQQSLIGPTIFPFYLFTLKRSLPLVLLVYAIAGSVTIIMSSNAAGWGEGLQRAIFGLVPTLLYFWAIVTFVFAAIDYAKDRYGISKKLAEWDPAKLPAVKVETEDVKPKSFAGRVLDLTLHIVWMLYAASIPWHPYWRIGSGVVGFDIDAFGVTFAPVWRVAYVLLMVLLTVQLVMKVLALRPGVHAGMVPMKLATNLLGLVGLGVIASSNAPFIAANASINLQKLAAVNQALSLGFRIALIFGVIGLFVNSWKYFKQHIPAKQFAF